MKIISTSDGSHTLYSEQFEENYHSRHGAIGESKHVYIEQGLNFLLSQPGYQLNQIRIFEVGFGTGLNAMLTFIEAQKQNLRIYYETIELYPVPLETIKELNYPQLLENEKYRPPFHSMHLSTWNAQHIIAPNFNFKKIQQSLFDYSPTEGSFHIIYFDAFAPSHQPEIWTGEVMHQMHQMLAPGGILVTYCSKSTFKQALHEAGFTFEKTPGPWGKRDMIRAQRNMAK